MDDTTVSFDLGLPEFRVLEVEETDQGIVIHVERVEEVGVCPDGHQPSDDVKQTSQWRWVQDLPIQGRTVWLKVRVRRYDCSNPTCGKRFSERFASFTGKQRSTHRLREHLAQTGKRLAHTEAAAVCGRRGCRSVGIWCGTWCWRRQSRWRPRRRRPWRRWDWMTLR
jgi:transposase